MNEYYGYCKFTTYCKYEHKKHIEENSDKIAKLEKIFQTINFQNSIGQSENYDKSYIDKLEEKITKMWKTMEKSLEVFEKKLDNQRNDLEEKNATITALEIRLEEVEKKQKNKNTKKIRK